MAYVSVPNDLSKIKTKVAFNLTKRQLLCFGAAAVVGIPTYLFTRTAIGNTGAMLLMIALMLPCFLIAMYERDGQPLEKVVRNIVRSKFLWPRTRPYQTHNFYSYLSNLGKEVSPNGTKNKTPARSRKKRKA
ncbi:PrgI family protein [Kineothrix alysoides]|uniref:PrgI family protein n=1 Tax=Kineothrix alysoides TaxID=1469948 RepID=A0A4R1QSI2_9FIRM|nr:PrgI family protein [Kineothrix alysoides]TCL55405.1 PrgI family protein [Kineothrix alysoides]